MIVEDGVVRPFRKLKRCMLPTMIMKNILKNSWTPIFTYLEEHVDISLPRDTKTMTNDDIQNYYDASVMILKERVSYCFAKNDKCLTWALGTWCTKISRSRVSLLGKDSDKDILPIETTRNRPREFKKRQRVQKEAPIYPQRQQKRRHLLSGEGNINPSVKTEREQKAAITILSSWRQRNIEGSSEEYPIDLVQSSNKKLLEYIGKGGDNKDDNNGDDDDGVVLVMTKPSLKPSSKPSLEDLTEDNSDNDAEAADDEPNGKVDGTIVSSGTLKEISSVFRLRLYRNDLRSLVGESWLNSKVMDCYNCLIEKDRKDLIILSVLVYTDILRLEPVDAVKKNKAMKSLKGIKVLYVPMTLGTSAVGGGGSHHMLCAVNFDEKKVKMYDSYRKNNEQDHTGRGEKILAFVKAKAMRDNVPLNVDEWKIVNETNSPQQSNGHDCGVFVCTLAYFLSEGKEMDVIVETMEAEDYIRLQRERMLFSLLYSVVGISLPFDGKLFPFGKN